MTAGVIEVTADVIEGYRLSPQQERLWLLQRESPQAPYHVQCVIRIEGPFDLQRLHTALRHVVRHHEILRTTFQYVPGMTLPVQVIAESGNVSINEYDLVDLTPSEQAARIGTMFHESFQQPFNLTHGPLMRISYGRLEATKHRLLISLPALCADRATLRNLAHEISRAYAACEQGKILTDVSLQYADFAEWQNALLEEKDSEAGRTYWHRLFDPTLLHNKLPFELRLGGTLGFTPRWLTVTIPSERVAQIDEVVQHYQTTASVFLLACWQILLQRLTGRTELLTGLTCEGRKYKEFKEALGPYAKSLPLRCSLNEHSRFSAIVAQLRDTTRENYEWQEYFTWEAMGESAGEAPFLPLCFEFEDQPPVDTSGDLSFIVDEQYSCIDRFKVKLVGIRRGDSIAATLHYDASLFQPEAMTCLAEQLKALIASAIHDPEAPVKELEILSEAEHQRVVIALNQTQANYPRDQLLHHLFEAQVARTPEATALVYEHQSFSYTELHRRANQLAHYLRGQRVGPNVLVGLCVERSPELIVGLLGILKAGGAYVPIDPDYPKERITYLLEDAQVSLLLTQQRLLVSLPETTTPIVGLDREGPVLTEHSVGNLSTIGTPDHLAYVIYTSGSTGRPKGVQITHRNVVHSTHARLRHYSDPITSFLLLSSFAFDSSVAGIFWTLSQGGTLCLVQEGLQKNPEALAELIAQQQVSHLLSLPSFYSLLLEQLPRHRLSSLDAVIVAGEACPRELMVRHHALLPTTRIFNEYGPTEGTVWSSVYESRSSDINLPVPIGRPITNMQVYLLDTRHKPVPIGIPGELYIGGVGIARGYLNRPELTTERFIPNPFGEEPGTRLYKTGDLARYLPDGNIEFLGRVDDQVKVRGFRIELGEIEARLLEHPEVRAAVVVAREDSPGDQRLVAYVVGRASVPRIDKLRAHLKGVLPEYMVPLAFMFLESLPLTPNGKVDRNALPVPDVAGQLGHQYVAPRTSTEGLLVGIWAEVLGLERVGIHDHFFELGGHSLLATQVVSRLRSLFEVELPLRSLFESPTVAELAQAVERARAEGVSVPVPPLVAVSRVGELALSFAQERLWFLDQLEPGSAAYNMPGALRLEGWLDHEGLVRAVNEIVRRHEVLRTTFATVAGRGVVVAPELELAIPAVDLSALPEETREAEVRRLAEEEAQQPFDLARGPLLRVGLLDLGVGAQTGEPEQVLLFTLHHIVSDGWSEDILVREFAALYEAFSQGQASPLPELPIQYADYAMWQRGWLQGEVLDRQLSYWRGQLAGAPAVLALPTDRPRPSVQSYRGASYEFTVSKELTTQLYALSRRAGVTLFMTLLAAFKVLLWRYSGQWDLCVGTPVANRTWVELEGLIGFFVNTLVLRTDLSGDPVFLELLARVRAGCLGAQAHQDLPFEKLVEELQPVRDMSHSPLFQVMFALQNTPSCALEVAGVRVSAVAADSQTAKFDLSLDLAEDEGELVGVLEYTTDLFDAPTIARMGGHYQALLEGIIAHPEARLSELPLLTEVERHRLLIEWNATAADHRVDVPLSVLFESQVQRMPDGVAVECGEESLSYRALNARANAITRALLAREVGPDTVIAVLAERGLDLLTMVMGIFKAGAAYLPLDPRHPTGRLTQIIESSRTPLILTQRSFIDTVDLAVAPLEWAYRPAVVMLESLDLTNRGGSEDPVPRGKPSNLAYVIYTSGSTGTPKGAMVERAGLLNNLLNKIPTLGLASNDVIAQSASQCFDISVWQFLTGLLCGARVRVIPDEVAQDPRRLLEEIDLRGITVLESVPSLIEEMLNCGEDLQLSRLRWLLPTGEALSAEGYRRWMARYPHVALLNAYGPAECADDVAYYRADSAPDEETLRVPIGKPVTNTRLYIVNRFLEPLPIGVAGELCVGGVGVGRGYLNDAVRTAEAFIPDPFSEAPGARLYQSGDVGRYRPDGNIEFLGRMDHQVKVRGFRIELGEIEARLLEYPEVRAAVVIVREDTPGDKRLVAYVVAKADGVAVGALRTYLKGVLPEYMVPLAFVFLERLPLTPNGKVDRNALPVPDVAGQLARQYVAPRTSTEELLAGIWAEVLDVERVGVHDNFFDLGGHSLLALRLIFRLREAFPREWPLRMLFDRPTIAALAELIGRGERGENVGENIPNLRTEAVLESDIRPDTAGVIAMPPREILLTGATGFLGAFLLYEFIERTDARIHCLVRARTIAEARGRLVDNLRRYALPVEGLDTQILPLCGDLAKPLLGLSKQAFHELAKQLDAVCHNGAVIGNVQPYSALKPTNVSSTREVLQLACTSRIKAVHFVSTEDVFGDRYGFITEDDWPDPEAGLDDGYAQSKWVAEQLVRVAGQRGLPVALYRPTFITGHSVTGMASGQDFINQLLKACIQLGKAPEEDYRFELAPVDYVSRCIVHFVNQPISLGRIFHLVSPENVSSRQIIGWLNDLGYAIEMVPYTDWRHAVQKAVGNDTTHPMFPLLAELAEVPAEPEPSASERRFTCPRTLEALQGSSIECPKIDISLFRIYLTHL